MSLNWSFQVSLLQNSLYYFFIPYCQFYRKVTSCQKFGHVEDFFFLTQAFARLLLKALEVYFFAFRKFDQCVG